MILKITCSAWRSVFVLLASFVLVSCGGGGGGSNSSSSLPTATATMQAGTIAVGSTEVGTSVTVSSNGTGQSVLTVENAGNKLTNAQAGQVMVFEASSAMPLGFAGIVQSVQTTSVSGVPTTTASYVPASIGNVFQNLNLNMSNVATNPQLIAGVALQNGVRAYTKTEPQRADGLLGTLQSGLIELNVLANNTSTTIGVDFSGNGGIKASFWKVNGQWVGTDPGIPLTPKVDIVFTGNIELQNPNFSQANIVIENSKLVTHNLQLQGTLKRNIKATVTGSFNVNANDLATLFSGATSSYSENNGYNEYSFDYKGSKIKVHGVEKDPAKIILGAAIISADGRFQPTYGNSMTGDVLKTVPVGMVVTFFMTADLQVQATASLGYQWRDMDINAGMGLSYNDSLGLPVSLLTGNTKPIVPFWNTTPYLNQPEGASYAVSGSATATLTAGIDGGIVLAGLEIAQATVEGGIRSNLSGQLSKPVGGTLGGCYSRASVTAGVRALFDVAAEVDLKTDFKSNWLKWFNASIATGYVYEFPMYPTAGVDWLGETTIWSVGDDTCHIPQFSATAGSALYSYNFDATATGYQPMVSSYTWDFGDGATATGVTTSHTYSTSGTYTATLTVLFSDGIQKTVSKTITVSAVPALNPAFTVGFSGLQASFDASISTPSADITGYAWDFGDGATGSGITAPHTYAAYSGTPWSVTLTVTDSYGRTASTSQNVTASCTAGQVIQNGQCVTSHPISLPVSISTDGYVTFNCPSGYTNVGYESFKGTYPDTSTHVSTNTLGPVFVCSMIGAGTYTMEKGFLNEASVIPDGNYWVRISKEGTPYNNTDFSGEWYYWTAQRTGGIWATGNINSLNDTGITSAQCYQAGSDVLVDCGSTGAIALNNAQDGMVGRDTNPATNSNTDGKLGFSFTSVPAAGSDPGGCVQDNVTGLMWEVKTTDGGLRDWTKTYTNYSATYDPNLQYGNATDASGFVTAVNATNLCGYRDWRLPTTDELQSIVDYSVASPGPAIDSTWFQNTKTSNWFWTSSPFDGSSSLAWVVDFSAGLLSGDGRSTSSHFVRLVRGGMSQTSPRYTVSIDGQEVTDNKTHLIWKSCPEGMNWNGTSCAGYAGTYHHEQALQDATAQANVTGIAWRLPSVKELASLVGNGFTNTLGGADAFPSYTPADLLYWSASPYVAPSSGLAWGVAFGNGWYYSNVGYAGRSSYYGYVRLVRDGP